ncbi:hypothetical protein Q8A67_022365 [Cirrhinus molitorella]|uniref:Uncharacterized protein n=1 Tax=Cirrhinus molitorella TaxID=172907 RepID=A0AA88PFJ2_9TELE|nr:hypothetical protein Q8A67_022365 [Cirrhinus molitorella]
MKEGVQRQREGKEKIVRRREKRSDGGRQPEERDRGKVLRLPVTDGEMETSGRRCYILATVDLRLQRQTQRPLHTLLSV